MDASRAEDALEMMCIYYNGYNFIPRSTGFIYNPTLCLYFFKQFQKRCRYPEEMLDANLASDDSKLEYITGLSGGEEIIFRLAEKGAQIHIPRMQKRFGLRNMLSDHSKDKKFIASFLYYFGILSLVGETALGELCLKVPNLVMQGMYVDRVLQMMLPDPVIRDRGGGCGQAELERRYADLTMILRPDKRHLNIFDVLIEFKFLRLKELNQRGESLRPLTPEQMHALPAVLKSHLRRPKSGDGLWKPPHRQMPNLATEAVCGCGAGIRADMLLASQCGGNLEIISKFWIRPNNKNENHRIQMAVNVIVQTPPPSGGRSGGGKMLSCQPVALPPAPSRWEEE